MDNLDQELRQANLELHEELGKETLINLENEAKIRRLEKQHNRYENEIQYLYNVISKLESQNEYNIESCNSLRTQLQEVFNRLKKSERINDEKEKFIQFRESQLLELEDEIYKLKERIKALTCNSYLTKQMASSSSNLNLTAKSKDELKTLIITNINALYRRLDPTLWDTQRPEFLRLRENAVDALTVLCNKYINDIHDIEVNSLTTVDSHRIRFQYELDEVKRQKDRIYNRFVKKRSKKRGWKRCANDLFNRNNETSDLCTRYEDRIREFENHARGNDNKYNRLFVLYRRSEELLKQTYEARIRALKVRLRAIELMNPQLNLINPIIAQPDIIWLPLL